MKILEGKQRLELCHLSAGVGTECKAAECYYI